MQEKTWTEKPPLAVGRDARCECASGTPGERLLSWRTVPWPPYEAKKLYQLQHFLIFFPNISSGLYNWTSGSTHGDRQWMDIQGVPGGYVHRIHVIAVNERVELGGGWWSFVSSRWEQRQLLTFLELLQVQNGLRVQTHTGQGLRQVTVTLVMKIAMDRNTKTQRCDGPHPQLASTFSS